MDDFLEIKSLNKEEQRKILREIEKQIELKKKEGIYMLFIIIRYLFLLTIIASTAYILYRINKQLE